jgi:hypothetical protein
MRWLLALVLTASVGPVAAEEKALPACPDKTIEAVLKVPDTPDGLEQLVFRLSSTRTEIAAFPSRAFTAGVSEILWSPDGRFAAFAARTTRRTRDLSVFHVTAEKVRQVKLEDYMQNIYGRLGILHASRGWSNRPLRWLAPDRLLISAAGDLSEEKSYDYEVEIRMIPDAEEIVGWLEKITDAKRDEE